MVMRQSLYKLLHCVVLVVHVDWHCKFQSVVLHITANYILCCGQQIDMAKWHCVL